MATTWEQIIRLILNGEDVDASVTNRPTSQLSARTQYLYDRLVATAIGEALYVHDVPVEDAAVVGDVMYYDDTESKYKRALAAVELDTEFGWYTISKSSYAIGILTEKQDTGLGSICTAGTLRNFDLTNSIQPGDPTDAGAYYLSMQVPGKITIQKPPVGIYVLYNRGDQTIHVMPVPKDMLEDHIHHKHELVAAAAGTATCASYPETGIAHQITNPNSALPGWLPADDPVFGGLAPEGAKFGYNLAKHESLLRVWPPQPLDGCHIEVNRGNGFQGMALGGDCADAIVNAQGIWWMKDCYGSVPWPPEAPCTPELVTLTVGGSVGMFATWRDVAQAIASFGPLEYDYDVVQVDDIYDGDTSPSVVTIDLNGHSLVMRSAVPHGGDPTVGYKTISTGTGVRSLWVYTVGAGSFEVKDLHFEFGHSSASALDVRTSGGDLRVHDIIATNTSTSGGTGVSVKGNTGVAPATIISVWNVETKNFQFGISLENGYTCARTYENLTSIGATTSGISFSGGVAGATCRNGIAQSAGSDFSNTATVTGYNNASVDATAADANWAGGAGVDNVTGITLGTEFESTTIGDYNFLKVTDLGVLYDGGATPAIPENTHGIRGNERPHDAAITSIGADEFPSSSSSSSSSSESPEECCQTPLEYRADALDRTKLSVILWFTKMVFKTDASVVTSLAPDGETSPITIVDCDGEPANTGQLFAGLDLSKLTVVEPVGGYNVVKSFGQNSVNRGPAVTGLKPGTGAAIAGIGTQGVDWQVQNGVYRGELLVGLENNLNDPRDFVPNLVSVNNVREEFDNVSQLFYLNFPANRASDIRNRVEIPRVNMPTAAIRAYLWFWFLGRSAGAIPKLTASYRRYRLATATPAALPSSDTDIVSGGWTPGVTLGGGDYAYAATPWFDVAVGDTVFYTIGWDGVPGPTAGFGIMRAGVRVEVKP
jgi:hypothetical protein